MRPEFLQYLLILGVYFLIGGAAVAWIASRKEQPEKRETWVKYFVYLLIVAALTFQMEYAKSITFYVLSAIVVGGSIEVLLAVMKIRKPWLAAVCMLWYIGIAFLALTYEDLSTMTFTVFFMVVIFDGFSQIFGQIMGGPKLIPRISPKKTWSGMLGGLLALVLTMMWIKGTQVWIFSILIAFVALSGDLLFSLVKRWAGIKDYSEVIPGHGGILDRFDSLLMVLAFFSMVGYIIQWTV